MGDNDKRNDNMPERANRLHKTLQQVALDVDVPC